MVHCSKYGSLTNGKRLFEPTKSQPRHPFKCTYHHKLYHKLPCIPPPPPLHKDTPVIGPFTAKQNIHPIISPSPSPLNIRPPRPCIEMDSIYHDVLKLDKKTVNYKRYFVSRLHDRPSECSHCQQQTCSGLRSPGRSYSTYL